jgi:hypothetical protein
MTLCELMPVKTLMDDQAVTASTESLVYDGVKGAYSFQIIWANGSSLDAEIYVEVSLDGTNYSPITSTYAELTDDSGNAFLDVVTGAKYLRVAIDITGGSADFTVLAKEAHYINYGSGVIS